MSYNETKEPSMAPVVVFVYNRIDHTTKILEKLNSLSEAKETDIFIFCDQAKKENVQDSVNEVREYVSRFKTEISRFKNTKLVLAEHNKGLAKSIIEGVSEVINKYGKVIVVEDDILVSNDFLKYMNAGLEYYASDKNIWSISGYTFPMRALTNYPHDVYASGRGCCWGWGSWANRWNTVDWEVKDYELFLASKKKRKEFSEWGYDLPLLLDACMNGNAQSWAIRWCFSAFCQGSITIYPCKSRVVNIGTDGSGTNYNKANNRFDTVLYEGNAECNFEHIDVDYRIKKEFAKKYFPFSMKVKTWIFKIYRLFRHRCG